MDKKSITMADIARHAGVSKATVSAVVNGKDSVGEETRARVQAVMDRFRYRPQSAARLTGKRGRKCLGFIIKESRNPYYAETLAGIQSVAQEAGFLVQVASSEGDLEREQHLVEQFSAQDVDGLIITPILHADADLSHLFDLKRLNVPFVLLERVPGLIANLVDIDNVQAARAATRHLLEGGHTRIVHFGGPAYSAHSEERARGVRLAFSESHLALAEEDVVPAGDTLRSGYEAAMSRFSSRPYPSAISCYNDLVALGAMRALQELGVAVPDEVSVMGFDDLEILDYLPIPLSTVRVPKRSMGETAARLLLNQIDSDGHAKPTRRTLDAELVIRASTRSVGEIAAGL
jgi:DNA-binding LacI/PurR family transcriptional regulator